MSLRREPLGPFERVSTETGVCFVQCRCGGYARWYDELAAKWLRSKRFGLLRLVALSPVVAAGLIRFLFQHLACVERDLA